MAMWKQLVALVRGSAFEAGQAVTDAKALTILDQQIRDAGNAQAKARDDMATLVARRRMIEKELEALDVQRSKYESSARAAMDRKPLSPPCVHSAATPGPDKLHEPVLCTASC